MFEVEMSVETAKSAFKVRPCKYNYVHNFFQSHINHVYASRRYVICPDNCITNQSVGYMVYFPPHFLRIAGHTIIGHARRRRMRFVKGLY